MKTITDANFKFVGHEGKFAAFVEVNPQHTEEPERLYLQRVKYVLKKFGWVLFWKGGYFELSYSTQRKLASSIVTREPNVGVIGYVSDRAGIPKSLLKVSAGR